VGDDESPDLLSTVQQQRNSPAKPELLQHSDDPARRVMTRPLFAHAGLELARPRRTTLTDQAWPWAVKKETLFK